jgi:predicted DNA-binding transcriptional regulator YafY
VRADRLVSLVLLLRRRGRMTADTLARELEVSTRTVLRDMEALSAAGVPVYAERGRHGGFALLPGFQTALTGLNHDEALALVVAGSRRGAQQFGLGSALASAMLKLVDALPDGLRDTAAGAAQRLLIDPETDLLARRVAADEVSAAIGAEVRRAVFAGHRLRIRYAAVDQAPRWRTVDPIGLVTVREQGYLLATRGGRTAPTGCPACWPPRPSTSPRGDRARSTWTGPGRNATRGSATEATSRSPCWSGWTRPGASPWWTPRWPSAPRRPKRTAGCG